MDIEERQVAGLVVKIDRLICVGFETCVEVAPDLFQMDEEGIAIFTSDTNEVDKETVLEACKECPVDALVVLDASGNQLHP
ncbi:MAG: ferredoxin [Gemmatimonadetes bacterium]|nr:ferredoxin [Gemmatimonadota bacterium]MEC7386415.1 ferredoxin [Gemmatimonadota bacterium]GIS78860.1 MAG: ferredoxin [Gammaproteobacteria bacterium]GIT50118.1 MAG: ferredoxin [Gemmatimonadota bacterium]HCK90041.1 ferredoxin [Gemmatimonadota bacterium]